MRRSLVQLLAGLLIAGGALVALPGVALAWYPNGLTKNLSCDVAPRPGAKVTMAQASEPPRGHEEPGSRTRTVHSSPAYTETEVTVRRASSFQVTSVTPCQGGRTTAGLRYLTFECQTTSTAKNSNGALLIMPNNPSVTPWTPC